jgi:hypothetical protein
MTHKEDLDVLQIETQRGEAALARRLIKSGHKKGEVARELGRTTRQLDALLRAYPKPRSLGR